MDELYTSNSDDPTTVNFSKRSTVRCERRIQIYLRKVRILFSYHLYDVLKGSIPRPANQYNIFFNTVTRMEEGKQMCKMAGSLYKYFTYNCCAQTV